MADNQKPPLDAEERIDRLRLARSENVGPVTFLDLIGHFGSARDAIEGLPALAKRGGRRSRIRVCSRRDAEAELVRLKAAGGHLVVWGEEDYPAPLAALADPPPVLSVLGDVSALARDACAMVGARNASANGRRFASQLAGDLGAGGCIVVSGLARGIDTATHQGSMASGTIALLGGGVDVIYPKENAGLYEGITNSGNGAIVSEVALGTQPQARHFPRRNRIIAGLSLGVVVVEAAPKSGSLITARFALEQGRELFAVPGSPLDPRARGTNRLIRDGAMLIETADDVLEALAPAREFTPAAPRISARDSMLGEPESAAGACDNARATVRDLLGPEPVAIDDLIRESQLTPGTVATILLELELVGSLERLPGGHVSLVKTVV